MKNILIIKWGALGDLLAVTPAISHIRMQYPKAKITYLTNSISYLITPEGTLVDKILNRQLLQKDLGFLGLLKLLRKESYDIVFNFKWGSESADILSLLSKSTIKVGGSKKRYLRYFYDYKPKFQKDDFNRHEYLKNFDIFNAYNKTEKNIKLYIYRSESDKNYIQKFLTINEINKYYVISPSASTLKKAWNQDNYIELSKYIIKNSDYKIVISYSPEDLQYVQNIATKIGLGCYLSPKTTINQVAVLVELATLCICNNSGIMHISYAVETPVMCFNTSIGWHPYGKNDISIDRIPTDIIDNRSLSNDTVEKLLSTISVNEACNLLDLK